MWGHFQTLRFRLAALYLVVFGLILTVLCVVVLAAREKDLRASFDERLTDRAETIIAEITVNPDYRVDQPSAEAPLRRVNPFRFPGYYFQVRIGDESVVDRSRNLRGRTLPLSDAAKASRTSRQPVLETLRGDTARSLLGKAGELRLLTLYEERAGVTPFYLQIGVSLTRVHESIRALRRIFLLVIPSALLMAAVASWLLARGSLAPIGRIAELAERLSAHDLSQRIDQPRGKDEVAALVTTLNQMLDRLSDAFQAQERFIADVSHELRTPLSVLLGEAQVLMQQERTPEEYERFVSSVQDEVRSLSQMVNSMLTLARADAGFATPVAADVSMNETVMDAVQRCQALAKQREVRLVPHLALPQADQPELLVRGDGELLRTMIANLLRNAIRHSPPDEVVDVKLIADGTNASITVRDRGPGIPSEYLGKVFDRFFRVPRERGTFKGVGLGLTIVRGVARLHDGSVVVSNHPDGGCEFEVHLPLHLAERPAEN